MEKMSKNEKRKNITLFMIIVFSILLAATSGITNIYVRVIFDVVLFVAQLVIVKAMLDDFYQE